MLKDPFQNPLHEIEDDERDTYVLREELVRSYHD